VGYRRSVAKVKQPEERNDGGSSEHGRRVVFVSVSVVPMSLDDS
jgi:hypothetical protein